MGFSRQEYWSGLPFPSRGGLSDPGVKPKSPALEADTLTSEPPEKPEVSEFLPLLSETENSDYPAMSEHPLERPTVCGETFSRCTAAPESLQEAFIKRKKAFIERSSQRQKEIKDKVHASGYSQTKTITEKTTGSFVSDLKGMSKVRVSLPEDKKTAQPHTHERAVGLYLQLAEMRKQKEDKAKQDAHAQNRARTKEFHKKTLEKLRARNIC